MIRRLELLSALSQDAPEMSRAMCRERAGLCVWNEQSIAAETNKAM